MLLLCRVGASLVGGDDAAHLRHGHRFAIVDPVEKLAPADLARAVGVENLHELRELLLADADTEVDHRAVELVPVHGAVVILVELLEDLEKDGADVTAAGAVGGDLLAKEQDDVEDGLLSAEECLLGDVHLLLGQLAVAVAVPLDLRGGEGGGRVRRTSSDGERGRERLARGKATVGKATTILTLAASALRSASDSSRSLL